MTKKFIMQVYDNILQLVKTKFSNNTFVNLNESVAIQIYFCYAYFNHSSPKNNRLKLKWNLIILLVVVSHLDWLDPESTWS